MAAPTLFATHFPTLQYYANRPRQAPRLAVCRSRYIHHTLWHEPDSLRGHARTHTRPLSLFYTLAPEFFIASRYLVLFPKFVFLPLELIMTGCLHTGFFLCLFSRKSGRTSPSSLPLPFFLLSLLDGAALISARSFGLPGVWPPSSSSSSLPLLMRPIATDAPSAEWYYRNANPRHRPESSRLIIVVPRPAHPIATAVADDIMTSSSVEFDEYEDDEDEYEERPYLLSRAASISSSVG